MTVTSSYNYYRNNMYNNEKINILVGINGSGKSTKLDEIASEKLYSGGNVIGIANTIYDKFTIRNNSRNYHVFKSSLGKLRSKSVIMDVLSRFEENLDKYYSHHLVFKYINYKPIIGFSIVGINTYLVDSMIYNSVIPKEDIEEIYYVLKNYRDKVIFDFSYGLDFEFFKKTNFIKILKYRKMLISYRVIRDIEVFVYKNNEEFNLDKASSGELSLLASLLFISINIDNDTTILIDEPENSLHPKWQIEYVKKLMDLFHFYTPQFFIATHSPLIVNGAETYFPSTKIYKASSFNEFKIQHSDLLNVEQIYEEYFDVTTPENRFVSEYVIKKFNSLIEMKISYSQFSQIINNFIENSYNQKQKNALKGILEMAEKYRNL